MESRNEEKEKEEKICEEGSVKENERLMKQQRRK
jgi:hypothetical protein